MIINNCNYYKLYTTSQILTIDRIIKVVRVEATLIHRFLHGIHRGKIEQIFLAYGLPKETVIAIMKLYNNTKVMVRSPDGGIDFFDIVAGVLQRDSLVINMFIIYLDYTNVDRSNERKWLYTIPHKLLRTQTMQMTTYFLEKHLPKPNPCYIVWNRQ